MRGGDPELADAEEAAAMGESQQAQRAQRRRRRLGEVVATQVPGDLEVNDAEEAAAQRRRG